MVINVIQEYLIQDDVIEMKNLILKLLDNHELGLEEVESDAVDTDPRFCVVQDSEGALQVQMEVQPDRDTAYIEEFVNAVAFPEDVKQKDRKDPRAFYSEINSFFEKYNPSYYYSPKTRLFFDAAKKTIGTDFFPVFLPTIYDNSVQDVIVFRELIENIKEIRSSKSFKSQYGKWRGNFDKSYKSTVQYVDMLFEKYSRLLVVRLDLGFKKSLDGDEFSVEATKKLLKRFLNAKRSNKIFEDLVGYVWKLEYGELKGYHYHLLIFLNGADAHKDVYRGLRMGEYWIELTEGKGIFYLSNLNKNYFNKRGLLGIGMISHFQKEKRGNLDRIVRYFFKEDQYMREKPKKGSRTFGKGEISLSSKIRVGRPRKQYGSDS